MRSLYNDETYKDIAFKTDSGKVIRAHRCMIAVSQVELLKMLLEFSNSNEEEILIPNCSDEALEIAVEWCYGIQSFSELKFKFEAASKFQCHSIARSGMPLTIERIKLAYQYAPEFDAEIAKFAVSWTVDKLIKECADEDVFIWFFGIIALDHEVYEIRKIWNSSPLAKTMPEATKVLMNRS